MSMLCFFPWVSIEKKIDFEAFELVPFRHGAAAHGELVELQGELDPPPHVSHLPQICPNAKKKKDLRLVVVSPF